MIKKTTIVLFIGLLSLVFPLSKPISAASNGMENSPNAIQYFVDAVNGDNSTGNGSQIYPWKTITYALSQTTGSGEEIHIAAGIYDDTLGETFPIVITNSVSLIGSDLNDVIISGQSSNNVIYIDGSANNIYSDTVLSNLTIQDGITGMQIFSTKSYSVSPTITNIRSRWNTTGISISTGTTYQNGATITGIISNTEVISNNQTGITIKSWGYLTASVVAPSFINCRVADNGSYGFYILGTATNYNGSNAAPQIISTHIENNGNHGIFAQGTYQGWSNPKIERSWIENNLGYGFYWAQGINRGNLNASITNTVIASNQGGGIYLDRRSEYYSGTRKLRIINSTISNNQNYGINWRRTSTYPFLDVTPEVFNTVIWNPGADDLYSSGNAWSTSEIQYSDIEDGDLTGEAGNLSQDPIFLNSANTDYEFMPINGSPIINAADNSVCPSVDIRGLSRPQDGICDIGAFEFIDFQTDYYVDAVNGDDSTGDGSQDYPWKTITHALSKTIGSGEQIHIAAGTYDVALGETFPLTIINSVSLIGSNRNDVIILGQSDESVVYIDGSGNNIYSETALSNITLQGGNIGLQIYSAESRSASPTIANIRTQQNTTGIYIATGSNYLDNANITGVISNTEVISNSQIGFYIQSYGYFRDSQVSPLISNCRVAGNGSYGFHIRGSAVGANGSTAAPQIASTHIENNGDHGVYAEGTYLGWSNPDIERSWIENNHGYGFYWAQGIGGGYVNARITNTVIASNQGGGIFIDRRPEEGNGSGELYVINSTISDNQNYGIYWSRTSTPSNLNIIPEVFNTILWNPGADDLYSNGDAWTGRQIQKSIIEDGDLSGEDGNFSQNPLFLNSTYPDYKYILTSGSPAIDSGAVNAGPNIGDGNIVCPSNDIRGLNRPQNETCEIGAFEFPYADIKYYVDAVNGNNSTGDGSQAYPWKTITFALTQTNGFGEEIHITAGIYNNALGEAFPLTINSSVSLIGSTRDDVVISGQNDKSIIYIDGSANNIYSETALNNITLQDGNIGLQIYTTESRSASPSITNIRSQWNTIGISLMAGNNDQYGATITGVISNTDVISNSQTGIDVQSYGDLSASQVSPLFSNCRVAGNGSFGFRIHGVSTNSNSSYANPQIVSTHIEDNGDHGIFAQGTQQGWSNPEIERSWIENNQGYGFYWAQGTGGGNIDASITNTVIASNQGGGIFLDRRSEKGSGTRELSVINSTISDNQNFGIYWSNTSVYPYLDVTPKVYNTILWNPGTDDLYSTGSTWTTNEIQYSDIEDGDLMGEAGNLSQDPLFLYPIDQDYRYNLANNSPAIDSGENTICPPVDITGVSRPQNETCDIGAFEIPFYVIFPIKIFLPLIIN